jgi:hypothetical protein
MTDLATLCAQLGIDQAKAEAALATGPRDEAPWYMQAVLGIGAWITSILALAFVLSILGLIIGLDEPNIGIAIVGALIFAGSLKLLFNAGDGVFRAQCAVAFATAGVVLAALGVGIQTESLWAAALATLPFAAAAIWQQRSQFLQFLVVSTTLVALLIAAWDAWGFLTTDIAAVSVPVGVALLLYPPRLDVRAAALTLLVVPELGILLASDFAMGLSSWQDVASWQGWPAKIIFLAVFGALAFLNWRRIENGRDRMLALFGIVLALAAAVPLPTGSAVALVLMLLGYTLGSRMLAVLGVLAEIYFLTWFYYDLNDTLLVKSIVLAVVGAVLLLCYGLVMRVDRRMDGRVAA